MTTTKKSFSVTCFLVLGLSASSFAQQMYASNSVKSPEAITAIMADAHSSAKTVDAKDPAIVSRFSALYPNATDLKWTSSAGNFQVSFVVNGRKGNASFKANGELNYVITNCSMEQLPAAFSKAIKKDYASYKLFNAKQITAYSKVAYQAILEDSKGYITLKYTEGEIEEIQQVKKN